MAKIRRPRVAIVFTGGTISMQFDPSAGGAVPMLSGHDILKQVPQIEEICDVTVIDFARLPGPHVTPKTMWELSKVVQAQLNDHAVDGVVVTHGTDTLEETAYLLDLTLRGDKPVVFVGAMRNSSELGWDGPPNLRSALRVAVDPAASGLGVVIVMNDQIILAAEAVKTHTEAVDTFKSRDFGPIGFVDKDRIFVTRHRAVREHIATTRLDEAVEIVKLSAGSNGNILRLLVQENIRGIVIEGVGRGNIPLPAVKAVEEIVVSEVPVIITSRCPQGRVLDTYAYEGAGKQFKHIGAVLGGMLPSHKARIKLMLLLGAGASMGKIRESFEFSV